MCWCYGGERQGFLVVLVCGAFMVVSMVVLILGLLCWCSWWLVLIFVVVLVVVFGGGYVFCGFSNT